MKTKTTPAESAALALADLRVAQRAGGSGSLSWGPKEVAWFNENCRSGQFDECGLIILAESLRKLQALRKDDFSAYHAALDSRNALQEQIGAALGLSAVKASDLHEILVAVRKLRAVPAVPTPPGANSDELLPQAWDLIRFVGRASPSLLQRRLTIGYNRAAKLIETLQELGYLGKTPPSGLPHFAVPPETEFNTGH